MKKKKMQQKKKMKINKKECEGKIQPIFAKLYQSGATPQG